MTFEEMQQIIQQMLGVQRELQEGQIRLAQRQEVFMSDLEGVQQSIQALTDISRESNVKVDRLIGYAINRERDLLDVQEDILNLKRRLARLEEQIGN